MAMRSPPPSHCISSFPRRALIFAMAAVWSIASVAAAVDPWDEASWVPEGGGIGGPPFQPAPDNSTARRECLRDSVAYVSSMDRLPTWALHILQSSSDVREGLHNAFPPLLGEFQGCASFLPSSSFLNIVGKYCVANVTLTGPRHENASAYGFYEVEPSWSVENYFLAFCASAACSPVGLSIAVRDFFKTSMENVGDARVYVNQFECKTWRREQEMHGGEFALLFLLVLFGAIVVIGTCYEGFMRAKRRDVNGPGSRILVSFSLLTNFPKLIAVTSNDRTMNFLFGLKFLSISWIVFGHTFYSTTMLPLTNPYYVGQFPQQWIRMLVLNESVAVDTFLLISGFLLALVFLRERESGVSFNPFAFYLHRILRLSPPYAIVVFFYATLFYRLGSGPVWDVLVGSNAKTCRANWWTNLLYVNNYVNIEEPCMDHSWYLAVDTQLYFVSPIVLFLMYKYRLFRLWLYPILVLVAVLVPFSITAVMKLRAAIFFNSTPEDVTGVFTNVYTRAYARAGPYLVGIGLGFLLHKCKREQMTIPKYFVALGWILSMTSCLAVVFGVYGLMQPDHSYNVWESSFYAGFHRTVWALGVGWVIFACCHGYAGPINTVLSWKLLAPLGRLTYCIYLIHYVVILYFAGSTRTNVYFSVNEVLRNFLGNLVIATFLATVLSLVFESPFIGISKAFVKREPKSSAVVASDAGVGPPCGESERDAAGDQSTDHRRRLSAVEEDEIRRLGVKGSGPDHAYSNDAYEATP